MFSLLLLTLLAVFTPAALASNTWYVDGVTGNDNNDCMSPQTACKTIGHAISLASSGDSISVAAAIYTENLTIGISLKIVGASPATTIVDGSQANRVFAISGGSVNVTLTNLTIRNGQSLAGGGILNAGKLTINSSTISGNTVLSNCSHGCLTPGGGIYNSTGAVLTINRTTISGNQAVAEGQSQGGRTAAGGGIYNTGKLLINNSTISGNLATIADAQECRSGLVTGGGIATSGTVSLNNATISGNTVDGETVTGLDCLAEGSNVYGPATLQNSVLTAPQAIGNTGGPENCYGTMTSLGYNLSDDASCNLSGPGDLNSTPGKLSLLGNYGGPTQTIREWAHSPTIEAGNPNGCTDSADHLLKTDQRGEPRPGRHKQVKRCDMGAFEIQTD